MTVRQFKDTMIAAKNYQNMIAFYKNFIGLCITEENEHFTMLKDEKTGQCLCITNGPSVSIPAPGIETDNLELAIKDLESLGGKIKKRWELGPMKGANCEDLEGNEIMIWQGTH